MPVGDVRLTANIREDLHLKLKIRAAKEHTTIGELIE
jgi:plasmid stability protein